MKAELTAWNKAFASGPPQDRPAIVQTLNAWRNDADLAAIRDAASLAKLPADEQKQWQALWARVPELWSMVPTAKEKGRRWHYTIEQPAEGWQQADFDDTRWKQGISAFGTHDYASVRTEWNTSDIWLRREFRLPEGKWDDLLLLFGHDDHAEIYINGVPALKELGVRFDELPLSPEARNALKPGRNVVAIHCKNTGGPGYIDAGIVVVKGNAGRLAYAQIAFDRKHYAFATQLWAAALANDPMLGGDRQAQHRLNAARAALLAAAGQARDEPPPNDAAKTKLRGLALDWLKAELSEWTSFHESVTPEHRSAVWQTLLSWQHEGALAGIRDAAALDKLPAEEQKACNQFWADVAALLTKCKLKVEIIKAEYGAGDRWKDVTEVLRKYVEGFPLIFLPSPDFNQVFGDPWPFVQKQLKIEYKINGQPGAITFPELAPILLPIPKGVGDAGALKPPVSTPFTDADPSTLVVFE
jgi:hypothetical protein